MNWGIKVQNNGVRLGFTLDEQRCVGKGMEYL